MPLMDAAMLFMIPGTPRITMKADDPTITAVDSGFMQLLSASKAAWREGSSFFSMKRQMKSFSM